MELINEIMRKLKCLWPYNKVWVKTENVIMLHHMLGIASCTLFSYEVSFANQFNWHSELEMINGFLKKNFNFQSIY